MTNDPRCHICGSARTKLEYTVRGYDHYRCLDCRGLYLFPLPGPDEFARVYQDPRYYSKAIQRGITNDVYRRLRTIEGITRQRGSLLDIGCAAGYFALVASQRGWRTVGMEQSLHTAAIARDIFGLEVINSSLEQADLPAGSFDVVTMWGVLEHVTQPRPFLRAAVDLLRPSGLLCLVTNNPNGWMARLMRDKFPFLIPPEHLCLYPVETLRTLLATVDMDVLRIETYDVISPDKTVRGLAKLLSLDCDYGRHPLIDVAGRAGSSIALPILRLLGSLNLGSEVELYARKPG